MYAREEKLMWKLVKEVWCRMHTSGRQELHPATLWYLKFKRRYFIKKETTVMDGEGHMFVESDIC